MQIPTRFIDLSLAYRWKARAEAEKEGTRTGGGDLLGEIAKVAGYNSGNHWWEEMIEKRSDAEDLFADIESLVGEVRSNPAFEDQVDNETLKREAFMRKEIRKAQKEGFQNIAVVCGAFHSPALSNFPAVKTDNALLKGMQKVKTTATWIPWTYERLSYSSGYGAGIHSPEWYNLIFHLDRQSVIEHWMSKTAQLFRKEGLDASPANVIEAVRLVDTLAKLRGQTTPGLQELYDAAQTIFCFGRSEPLQLIEENLIIGKRMGAVPDEAPTLPLQANIKKLQKSLRLKISNVSQIVELDLRKDLHLRKSQFLHRLNLLDIPWGEIQKVGKLKKGTFHENWEIKWRPELEINIVEAANWGNTVEQACTNKVFGEIQQEKSLNELTILLEQIFLADLGELVPFITEKLSSKAALSADMQHFLQALPPLINMTRYGNVRQVDSELVKNVIDDIFPRLVIGLPRTCTNIEEEFAETIFEQMIKVNGSIQLLGESYFEAWQDMLLKMANSISVYPKIGGAASRILFDNHQINDESAEKFMSLAVSPSVDSNLAAAWVEGFLHGSGLLLIHNPALWGILDKWLNSLSEHYFTESLPVLRRTFSQFSQAERRQMGQIAKEGPSARLTGEERVLNLVNVNKVLPILKEILGKG